MNNIISVVGLRGSGKDTVAGMLSYCLNTPKFMWGYKLFRLRKFIPKIKRYKIVAFAQPLKKMLSILLNVPVSKFENRDFKENYYVDFNTLTIDKSDTMPSKLNDNQFSKAIKSGDIITNDHSLSIRQLMQYFGTEVMRKYFGDNLWILCTLKSRKRLIISDLRFKIEAEYVKKYGGLIIYIQRDSCKPTQHISEQENLEIRDNHQYDYLIENNGTIEDLFNNVTSVLKSIK